MTNEDKDNLISLKDFVAREMFFREKRGISARELSLRLEKHDSYINKLESVGFVVPITVAYKMIEALGISKSEFFADDYKNYKINEEIYNLIKNMSEDSKLSILNIIKNMKTN